MNEQPAPPPEGELITAALKRRRPKLSVREAARRAGISEGWWRQVVRGYQPLKGGGRAPMAGSAETLARMARVVGVTPEQLDEAGRPDAAEELRILEPPDDGRSFDEAATEAEKALTRIEKAIEARADDRERPLGEAAIGVIRAILEKSTNGAPDA